PIVVIPVALDLLNVRVREAAQDVPPGQWNLCGGSNVAVLKPADQRCAVNPGFLRGLICRICLVGHATQRSIHFGKYQLRSTKRIRLVSAIAVPPPTGKPDNPLHSPFPPSSVRAGMD